MKLNLEKSLAPDAAASEGDVRAVKLALHRLGVYTPDPHVGMSDMADGRLFDSIRTFQKAQGLVPSGRMRAGRDDLTLARMNKELDAAEEASGFYRWESVGDDKVRADHAARTGQIFSWEDHPWPGEEYGCRCWAVLIEDIDEINDPPIEPVYPELIFIPFLRFKKIINVVKTFSSYTVDKSSSDLRLTGHARERAIERDISDQEIRNAISSAKKEGNVIRKFGKYKTLQDHYIGKNGVTVIIESSGKNAGQIITLYRHGG